MKVKELLLWLKAQDSDATVEVAPHGLLVMQQYSDTKRTFIYVPSVERDYVERVEGDVSRKEGN